jgi:hypothetical protein
MMISFPERSPSHAVISAAWMVIWVISRSPCMKIEVGYVCVTELNSQIIGIHCHFSNIHQKKVKKDVEYHLYPRQYLDRP